MRSEPTSPNGRRSYFDKRVDRLWFKRRANCLSRNLGSEKEMSTGDGEARSTKRCNTMSFTVCKGVLVCEGMGTSRAGEGSYPSCVTNPWTLRVLLQWHLNPSDPEILNLPAKILARSDGWGGGASSGGRGGEGALHTKS